MRVSLPLAVFTLAVLGSSSARADSSVEYSSPNVARREPDRKWVTITVNPLGVLIGRYGANVDVVPFVHHGIALTGFYVNTTGGVYENGKPETRREERVQSVGGELGYRLYSGKRGANG